MLSGAHPAYLYYFQGGPFFGCIFEDKIFKQYNTNLISSFIVKFTVNRKVVCGSSCPRSCVWFPRPLNTHISGRVNMLECVGSSQHRGILVFAKSDTTNSADDWQTLCNPSSLLIKRKAVDFPLVVAPIAVATGHDPKN